MSAAREYSRPKDTNKWLLHTPSILAEELIDSEDFLDKVKSFLDTKRTSIKGKDID